MLVFTRKKNETIMIGDGIEVRVLSVGRGGVRVGIVAPPDVAVHRQEIYQQIRDANRFAADTPEKVSAIVERLRKRG
jgi:carbon storage regulator